MSYIYEIFRNIPGIFLDYFQIILDILYVCQFISQSLMSLPIGHFSGSTSETSGLVYIDYTSCSYFFIAFISVIVVFLLSTLSSFDVFLYFGIKFLPDLYHTFKGLFIHTFQLNISIDNWYSQTDMDFLILLS